jgi:Dual specificity phosphatase, catalytic domain
MSGLDITQITPQLWTGGAITSDADVRGLVALGIDADIDCRVSPDTSIGKFSGLSDTPDSLKSHPTLKYLYDGMPDDGVAKPVAWFAKAWTFAKPILERGGVVLAHCSAGTNRGPSMCYFLLRAYMHMSANDAFALIKSKRSGAECCYRSDADRAIMALGLAPMAEVARAIDAARLLSAL